MEALRRYLADVPPGPIGNTVKLESLLALCWDQFGGSSDGGMNWEKRFGRMERMVWNPPNLKFTIERHGGTVNGSSRAELQHWSLDLDTATLEKVGRRQLSPMQPRLDVVALAETIASLIANGEQHDFLKWFGKGRVRVLIGTILPKGSAVKQTLAGRRKRFWKAMIAQEVVGWTWLGRGVFEHGEVETENG